MKIFHHDKNNDHAIDVCVYIVKYLLCFFNEARKNIHPVWDYTALGYAVIEGKCICIGLCENNFF